MADLHSDATRPPAHPTRSRSYLGVEGLLLGVSVFLLGGAALLLAHYGFTTRPEVVLTLVVLLGIVVLLVAIGAFVALLRGFDLADGRYALGLPDGSVRAILALGLLLVFSMISVFLYWDAAHPGVLKSVGITPDQLAKLAAGSVISISPGATTGTFDVQTIVANQNAQQLGQQLVTILGTLVTAIAAFYFGATSVASATKPSGDAGNGLDARPNDASKGPPPEGPETLPVPSESSEEHVSAAREAAATAQSAATDAQRWATQAKQAFLNTRAALGPRPKLDKGQGEGDSRP